MVGGSRRLCPVGWLQHANRRVQAGERGSGNGASQRRPLSTQHSLGTHCSRAAAPLGAGCCAAPCAACTCDSSRTVPATPRGAAPPSPEAAGSPMTVGRVRRRPRTAWRQPCCWATPLRQQRSWLVATAALCRRGNISSSGMCGLASRGKRPRSPEPLANRSSRCSSSGLPARSAAPASLSGSPAAAPLQGGCWRLASSLLRIDCSI